MCWMLICEDDTQYFNKRKRKVCKQHLITIIYGSGFSKALGTIDLCLKHIVQLHIKVPFYHIATYNGSVSTYLTFSNYPVSEDTIWREKLSIRKCLWLKSLPIIACPENIMSRSLNPCFYFSNKKINTMRFH